MADPIDRFRRSILRFHPGLAGSSFRLHHEGWDSTAVEVGGLIFKFPRHAAAERALHREAALLALIRRRVSMPVPDLRIHHGPPVFSCHAKLPGEHLLAEGYRRLSERARHHLGEALGRFYAELHQLDTRQIKAAGAGPVEAWQTPQAVRARALPKLPPPLRQWAADIVSGFEGLPPDPYGTTYGFFDGHGWNMAFDHERGRLNGIYDFADSGFGPLHREFIYSNFISEDLTRRVVAAYEARTGRALDRSRIAILTGFHRLSELAELADDPEHAPYMIRFVADWATRSPASHGPDEAQRNPGKSPSS